MTKTRTTCRPDETTSKLARNLLLSTTEAVEVRRRIRAAVVEARRATGDTHLRAAELLGISVRELDELEFVLAHPGHRRAPLAAAAARVVLETEVRRATEVYVVGGGGVYHPLMTCESITNAKSTAAATTERAARSAGRTRCRKCTADADKERLLPLPQNLMGVRDEKCATERRRKTRTARSR